VSSCRAVADSLIAFLAYQRILTIARAATAKKTLIQSLH